MTDQNERQLAFVLTAVAVALGAFVLFLSIAEEPYHIDELRQTRAYDRSLGRVVDASFEQEQPPLDPLLNATAQRVIGVGDVQQRLLPALAGVGSLTLFGALLFRSGLGVGTPVGVGLMAIAPGLIAVTVYARPYAIPLFLALLFLEESDRWLRTGSRVAAGAVIGSAFLLPLSRTVEPPLLLAAVAGWLVLRRLRGAKSDEGRWRLPVIAAALGLGLVALPVLARLSGQLAEYTAEDGLAWAGLSRFQTELPGVLWDQFSFFGYAIAIAVAAWPPARRQLFRLWWFWPLAAVPVGFVVIFFLRTPANQAYYDRYAFSWWPPVAVMAAVLVHVALEHRTARPVAALGVALVAGLGLWSAVGLRSQLAETELPDWHAVGSLIEAEVPPDSIILYDHVRNHGLYRTGFSGWPRYLSSHERPLLSVQIASNPDLVPDDANIVVALLGSHPAVRGWSRDRVDEFFTVYQPLETRRGRLDAADTLVEFGLAVGPSKGASMMLAAASLYELADLHEQATEATCQALDVEASVAGQVRSSAVRIGLPLSACPLG